MPTPEVSEAAPLWTQVLLGLAGAGSFLGMIAAAIRPKNEDATAHLAKETMSLVDDRPARLGMERIEAYLRRVADNSDILVGIERRRNEREEQNQLRAEARIEAQEEQTRLRLNDSLERLDREERERKRKERE